MTPRNRYVSAASLIDTAQPEQSQELNTTHVQASKRVFRERLPPIFTRVTKDHTCHEICTWSPLRAPVPMRFLQNIRQKSHEPRSKSIAYAWYKNMGYRFLGGPYRFAVFCSNQHWRMQKCSGIGFKFLNCRGWINGRSLSLRLQSCWGAIRRYLSTFLGFSLSKEIGYNHNSELDQRLQKFKLGPVDFFVEPFFLVGIKWVYPSSGVLFQQKVIARLSLRLSLNSNTLMIKKGKEREM